MANQIKVHTDANYRIRDNLGPVIQSARYFNTNNCMQNRSMRRNIISNHYVQPYTLRFDDGTCDYSIARASELEGNNLQYHFRPQNYEEQLGLDPNNISLNANSEVDKMYGLGTQGARGTLDFDTSSNYYPYAYGNNITQNGGIGNGVMGNFQLAQLSGMTGVPGGPNHPVYEPYKYMSGSAPYNTNTLIDDANRRNFGALAPKDDAGIYQTPNHYSNADADLSYRSVDLGRIHSRSTNAYPRGVSYQGNELRPVSENFRPQPQPRGGSVGYQPNFFFEQPEKFISPLYNDPGYSRYKVQGDNMAMNKSFSNEKMKELVESLVMERGNLAKNIVEMVQKGGSNASPFANVDGTEVVAQLKALEDNYLQIVGENQIKISERQQLTVPANLNLSEKELLQLNSMVARINAVHDNIFNMRASGNVSISDSGEVTVLEPTLDPLRQRQAAPEYIPGLTNPPQQ